MTRTFFLLALSVALASGAMAQTAPEHASGADLVEIGYDDVFDEVTYDEPGEIIDISATPQVTVEPGTRAILDLLSSDDKGSALLRLAVFAMMQNAQPLSGPAEVMQPLDTAPLATLVAFEVSGTASGAATDFLVGLAESEGLGSLSASTTSGGDTSVQARFSFRSMDAWAEWRALPETEALLEALSGGAIGVRTELSVTRLGR